MCFSAEASFAGGVIISTIGIATIRKIHKPAQLVLGCIPVFFGIQQIAEGFLWVTLPLPDYHTIQKISAYMFLVMAQVLWPVWIPLSILFLEKSEKRRRLLWVLLALGLLLALYYAYCLVFFNITPQIIKYHIQYSNDFPKSVRMIAFVIYLIATITPLFVSGIKKMHLFGILMFLSCLVTAIFFRQYLTSVWCFFAALISGVIFWILRESKEDFISEKSVLLQT